jgi:aminocarboxymuconate-semialdehyde decarboxylase
MLGSDYPFPLGEEIPGTLIRESNLSAEITKKLLGDNALKWLGVPKDHFIK